MGFHFHFISQWLRSVYYMLLDLQRPHPWPKPAGKKKRIVLCVWRSRGAIEWRVVWQWVGPREEAWHWIPMKGKGRYLQPQIFTLTLNQRGVLAGHMPNSPGGRSSSAPSFTSTCIFPSQTHLQLLIIPHVEIATSVKVYSTTNLNQQINPTRCSHFVSFIPQHCASQLDLHRFLWLVAFSYLQLASFFPVDPIRTNNVIHF